MAGKISRPFPRRYGQWHPVVCATPAGTLLRGGVPDFVPLGGGPFGPVGPVGTTDHPYTGMDPSDPVTWTRPYRPVAGMVAWLNFDGAVPNVTQTTGGPRLRRKRARS
jgi:hypothetical protein